MATIQVRDIPEDAYEVLRRRARAEGKSLQAYMRDQVIDMAARRTKAEVLAVLEATLAEEPTSGVTAESVATHVSADRR
ncbi:FitA-like ribbon-helix-helix domain-containing protein [Gandjariella thermophila]|uniref:Putative antitoxin VapB1 n=1 Tax=Gandjariella thermophila TaxID=1931992 RepID=A0A4D4J890_9PSEU|nr:antitoxin [Gandjariella thermophila]GDY31442.1 putative antitoxin VapB1 [Gandjariella thermophila]